MQTWLSPYVYYFLCVGLSDYQGRASQVRVAVINPFQQYSQILYYFLISCNISICSKLICMQHHQTTVLNKVRNCVEPPTLCTHQRHLFSSQPNVFLFVTLVTSSLMVFLNRETFIHAIARRTYIWIIFRILH